MENIIFIGQVRQGIVAVAMTALLANVATTPNIEYCRSTLDYSRSMAALFGIPWPTIQADLQAALAEQGASALLESVTKALPH
jgi:hypothetical protein